MSKDYPTLSLKERGRRWKITREPLKSYDMDCLVIPGSRGFPVFYGYICNDHSNGTVVFPLEGEPTCLCWNYNIKLRHLKDIRRGVEPWVTDWEAAA